MSKEPFIYGIRPVIEAIKSGKEIEKLLIQKGLRGEGFHQLHSFIREFEIPFQFVPIEKLNRTTRQNHQGIIAYLSEISYQKLEYIIPFIYEQGKSPLILVLDRITDVRNLGAIARTAECAGVDGLLLPSKGSAQVNADAVKTSAGALYKLPVSGSLLLQKRQPQTIQRLTSPSHWRLSWVLKKMAFPLNISKWLMS
jgi:23S rRNA (guanosine2251-2'-O)-methyltransferase